MSRENFIEFIEGGKMSDKKITTYEAEYKKQYAGLDLFGRADLTAVRKIGQLIDSQWFHSLHWPREVNSKWRDAVNESLNTEMQDAVKRLNDLKLAEKILNSIDFDRDDEDE